MTEQPTMNKTTDLTNDGTAEKQMMAMSARDICGGVNPL